MNPIYVSRRRKNIVVKFLCLGAAAFGVTWLALILVTLLYNGIAGLNLQLFTENTPPPGSTEGGLLNAIVGSLIMTLIGVGIGAPLGMLAGTYMAEYGRHDKLTSVVRFINDILLSAPSIIIGLFIYELVVRQTGRFSGYAGGIALGFIFLPVVVRTTDEMLRLVPDVMREAALSLGIPRWKVTVHVLYRAASAGILTGVLLAVARISGETAPLLFTALNNQYWSTDMSGPMANIPVVIFQYAMSPYDEWHTLAWAGAFVMTAIVLLLSVGSRIILSRRGK